MEKILVCVTPQHNGLKLIDRAAQEAERLNGELHILNVQKGDSIFFREDSGELLEELFSHGNKKGGFIHALAGNNVPQLIISFAKKHEITKIVVGEPPRAAPVSGVLESLDKNLEGMGIEIIVLEREWE